MTLKASVPVQTIQPPVLRAKLRVVDVQKRDKDWHLMSEDVPDAAVCTEIVRLIAVWGNDVENKHWANLTPSASFEIGLSNPQAYGRFIKDQDYYIDFTPAPKADA